MAIQKRQEQFAQVASGVVAYGHRTRRTLMETPGHEQWKQRLEDDWQSHLETLQIYVRELLVRNQQM